MQLPKANMTTGGKARKVPPFMGQHLGREFVRLREARGLSQAEVARRARGVARGTLSALESGKHVKLDTLRLLAEAMRVQRHELLLLVTAWIHDCIGEDLWAQVSIKVVPEKKAD